MNTKTTFHAISESAWILGVSRNTVSRAIRTGALRATRCRTGLRVSSAELAKALQDGGAAWTTSS
ncbi:helix-turn-helix domain-containing protein [Amycolatopsis jiangsuensis]|uniref:Excisionase family DNA binding protein n=1 Tax=Amycolatopsis jiangsuensis TaxID=1181879 RepID=A0A840IRR0_9PSEU|nr:helix-turn-helix domain-containing protein [Amycolatopsis jiangsuensis]MBB4683714.1 excisionase family DNA binding protein [Amycolatopsis jiangsuensis]